MTKLVDGCARPVAGISLTVLALSAAWAAFGLDHGEVEYAGTASAGLVATSERVADPQSCSACHRFEGVHSHPVNIRALEVPGSSLPLQDGRLTCLTCHDAGVDHATGRAPVGVRGGSAAALCVTCHSGGDGGTKAMHAAAIGRAHLSHKRETGSRAFGGLDAESAMCVSCHDGASAKEAGSHSVRMMSSELLADHPIGVKLMATERTRGGDFRIASPGSIDRRIRLFDGNLGCGSCHSAYSKEPHLLVMNNRGSKMCLSCHTQ